MPQQVEQEVKLDVTPGWSVPDLTGVIAGVRVVGLPALALEATYYDTVDLRLARHQVTLRVRRETEVAGGAGAGGAGAGGAGAGGAGAGGAGAGGAGAGGAGRGGTRSGRPVGEWTLKLPTEPDGDVLARQEVTWPVSKGRASGPNGVPSTSPVQADAAKMVRAIALGLPLVPVAYLATFRQRAQVLTSDGRRLAEIDHDRVSGRRLLPQSVEARPDKGTGPDVKFEEVEVELAPGSAVEVLHAVVERLGFSGAKPSKQPSKLRTVLGEAQCGAQLVASALGPSRLSTGPVLLVDVVQRQAALCLDELLQHDLALRNEKLAGEGQHGKGVGVDDDGEHVHKARVAVRRFSTVLRSVHRQLERERGPRSATVMAWLAPFFDDLRWLGDVLGEARDSDVRALSISNRCTDLPPDDIDGAMALAKKARHDQENYHRRLHSALASDRYLHVLRSLQGLAQPGSPGSDGPPAQLWDRLTGRATPQVNLMVAREWRSLRKTVQRGGRAPSDEALHRARKKTKRLRYLAEVAAPLNRGGDKKGATLTAEVATALQDVLGALHDEVVTQAWLRRAAGLGPQPRIATPKTGPMVGADVCSDGGPALALAAGQLLAGTRQRHQAGQQAWVGPWDDLCSKKVTGWLR